MKDEFNGYLKSLEATDVVLKRGEKVFELYSQLIAEFDATEIFVSEDLNQDKTREWRSLIVFTKEYMLEAKNFVAETDLDVAYLFKSICYVRMRFKDYEPGQAATTESRFRVDGYFVSDIDFQLRASEKNCERLWQICRTILLPNWEEPEVAKKNADSKPYGPAN